MTPSHQRPRRGTHRRGRRNRRSTDRPAGPEHQRCAPGMESSWAPAASNGIRFWCKPFCAARCTARSLRPTTPATGCAWRWHTARIWPTWARRGGCRSCRSRATPSRANHAAAAYVWNELGRGASSSTGRAAIRQRGVRLQLDGRRFPLPRPPRRVRQRPRMDGVRFSSPAALRISGYRSGRTRSGLVLRVGGPRRVGRQDRHRRRRPNPHHREHGTAMWLPAPIPTSAAVPAHTTGTGVTTAPQHSPARRSARSTPLRTTRCRCAWARWAPRADRAPTMTGAFSMSAVSRYRAFSPRATRWPV